MQINVNCRYCQENRMCQHPKRIRRGFCHASRVMCRTAMGKTCDVQSPPPRPRQAPPPPKSAP
jgi:hypothetical protein